ncbi:hypothetical protein [Sphingopyxis sp.]|uniref:hypothetical protein n=1 Tax=Sphingopyxis sp. TaxID=1908224 RepID=UPI002585EC2C|nr:hypothetical protein [Sphingopyxis sp.]
MMSLMLSLALAAAGTEAPPPAMSAKPKKICEKVESTGSAVPKRICRTVVESAPPKDDAHADGDKPSTAATN